MNKRDISILQVCVILLSIIGSFMIASAEMSSSSYSGSNLIIGVLKQFLVVGVCILAMFAANKIDFIYRLTKIALWIFYGIIVVLLVSCYFFGSTGGSYAWIRLGPLSLQPSEFAKVFVILMGAKYLGKDQKEENYKNNITYLFASAILSFIVLLIQRDTGSAAVILAIAVAISMIASNKETRGIRIILYILFFALIVGVVILLSPKTIAWLSENNSNYIVGRIIAAANPFADQYDTGYHLIMSLVSFATGGWFGLGYSQSIHKYMNFPNPDTDFILAVIVEEMGFIGFLVILVLYTIIAVILIKISMKTNNEMTKIICFGTFIYLVVHFVLNVGGVTGCLPLTGVPLLLLSSGGSSTLAFMISIGMCVHQAKKEIQ